ncbi:hypothetical protein M199_gp089 [Halogranum tailed virus 1]|uniref:Uncharacterized protein n=1 Tax=Halogranum tailed virus 1 TaxID=1273749 RepID=R4TLJ8_9CAUD|nr:hypothetical protein M199_gp089 [Halogranum tailed virus 1]AGM11577.1 hypothetical protein HGTV1_280 [Halogranum tailed virus 1]
MNMDAHTVFDVMYEVELPVSNVWEARMVAQGLLWKDMKHGADYTIEAWDAELGSVQFRVVVWDEDVLASDYFHKAEGARRAEV